MTASTFVPTGAPLAGSPAGIASFTSTSLYLAAPEGADVAALAEESLAWNESLEAPAERVVIKTQHWSAPYELPSSAAEQLQQQAERFGIAIEVKTAQAPYIHEFASAAIRAQQASAGIMLASMAHGIDALIEELGSVDGPRVLKALEIIQQIGPAARETLRAILSIKVFDICWESVVHLNKEARIRDVYRRTQSLDRLRDATVKTLFPDVCERRDALLALARDERLDVRVDVQHRLLGLLPRIVDHTVNIANEAQQWSDDEIIHFSSPITGSLLERAAHENNAHICRVDDLVLNCFFPAPERAADAEEIHEWILLMTAYSAWIHDPEIGGVASEVVRTACRINPYLAANFSID